jgi:ketosteroid isomerase-like protein
VGEQGPEDANVDVVRRFYDTFQSQQLDDFVNVLHPEVELQSARGLRRGLNEAREWALKVETGELDQRFVVDELIASGDHVLALVRKQWWWRKEDELADESPVAALFTIRDDRIARWQPFEDRTEAYRAAGLQPP